MWRSPRDPSIYGSMDVDATAALAFLADHQHATGTRLTITHLVARAVALALHDQPELNGKVRFWGRLERRTTIDVFVTVATGGDLSGARIERADEKSLVELAREIADRAGKIRGGADASYRKSRSMLSAMPWWLTRPTTWLSDVLVNELHVDLSSQGLPPDPFGSAIVTSVGMFGIGFGVRAVRAARALPDAVLLVARDLPAPVGDRRSRRGQAQPCCACARRSITGSSTAPPPVASRRG